MATKERGFAGAVVVAVCVIAEVLVEHGVRRVVRSVSSWRQRRRTRKKAQSTGR